MVTRCCSNCRQGHTECPTPQACEISDKEYFEDLRYATYIALAVLVVAITIAAL